MTSRDRRALRMGLGLVFGLTLVGRGVPLGLRWFTETKTAIAASRVLLARQQAHIESLPDLEARSDSLRTAVARLAGQLLPGATDAEAQTALLAAIESASSRSGSRLDQLEPLADTVGFGRLRRVQARATVSADLTRILTLVDQIESGRQIGLVRALRLELASDPQAPTAEVLHGELVIEGWFLRRDGMASGG